MQKYYEFAAEPQKHIEKRQKKRKKDSPWQSTYTYTERKREAERRGILV